MKGELSENDLRYKAEAYCSSMERCIADVEAKLSQWGASPEIMAKIIKYLQDEKYIDQKRFCSALRLKKIPADIIALGMEEIDDREYLEILSGLIEQKKRSVKARTEYERNGKLIRYAVGKGFEMEAICRCVKRADEDDVYSD